MHKFYAVYERACTVIYPELCYSLVSRDNPVADYFSLDKSGTIFYNGAEKQLPI